MPPDVAHRPRLGVLVNPIAGMGGPAALKGTDGAATLALARERGATPVAPDRARRALRRLASSDTPVSVLAAPGDMGGALAEQTGLPTETTGPARDGETGAEDTRAAAAEMLRRGVDLLLFAGGDGTARDIHDAIGAGLPMVGVPTGVKMHSGVFAATPEAAGLAAERFLRAPDEAWLHDAEIADVDEDAVRAGRVSTRLYGTARVPRLPGLMVGAKTPSAPSADGALDALCRQVAEEMAPERLYLLGPGTTTAAVLAALGLSGTLLGVDAVADGRLAGADLDEAGLLDLLERQPDARLLLGVVGGQGSLLGRGNQQLGPRVLRRLGRDRIQVLAASDKLLALSPPLLRVDTGDPALDRALSGHIRVHVAPHRTIVMKVST